MMKHRLMSEMDRGNGCLELQQCLNDTAEVLMQMYQNEANVIRQWQVAK